MRTFTEAALQSILVTTMAELDAEQVSEEDWDSWDELDERVEAHQCGAVPPGWSIDGRHQLGGHARTIQRPVEVECV